MFIGARTGVGREDGGQRTSAEPNALNGASRDASKLIRNIINTLPFLSLSI